MIEKSWVETTADWLREHQVVRAFVASHNNPNQFAEESAFYVVALQAQVKYVVRISTTAAAVSPDCLVCAHTGQSRLCWARRNSTLNSMQWTSLQPNIFALYYIASAAEFIQNYRKFGA